MDSKGAAALAVGGIADNATNRDLIERRRSSLGGSMLFYKDPLLIARGEGAWLFDQSGRRYLDCYNNVASVGHCNPKVVAALCQQAQRLNTNTRYLHQEVVTYAERITANFPDELDICLMVCTGTEANELAMRIARSVTGKRGAVVMENAYHGNSSLINELSTVAVATEDRAPYVAAVEPPNVYRGPFLDPATAGSKYAGLVDIAIASLEQNGEGLAAFMCDTIFDTQGTLEAPLDYFSKVYASIRAAGGLCIADEVQAGLVRTGKMWGFEHYGVVPDIVTLGKPMGDGHPIGIVVTSSKLLAQFSEQNFYFNTFGGNPVSAAVGNAVLDVIEEDLLLPHVQDVSSYLRTLLEELASKHAVIGDVRGKGLFLGIELVKDKSTKEPATALTRVIAEKMRDEGVLIGATGRFGNVLKVRPPLIFSRENADFMVEKLEKILLENKN